MCPLPVLALSELVGEEAMAGLTLASHSDTLGDRFGGCLAARAQIAGAGKQAPVATRDPKALAGDN